MLSIIPHGGMSIFGELFNFYNGKILNLFLTVAIPTTSRDLTDPVHGNDPVRPWSGGWCVDIKEKKPNGNKF